MMVLRFGRKDHNFLCKSTQKITSLEVFWSKKKMFQTTANSNKIKLISFSLVNLVTFSCQPGCDKKIDCFLKIIQRTQKIV